MDSHFLDDCGLQGDGDFNKNLDEVRQEYFCTRARDREDTISGGSSSDESDSDIEQFGEQHETENQNSNIPAEAIEEIEETDDMQSEITDFIDTSCGCTYGKNKGPCSQFFSFEVMFEHRLQCVELTSTELDLVILGALQSQIMIMAGNKRMRSRYYFLGHQVCKKTFSFLYGIGKHRLQSLKSHLKNNGISPRRHGNISRLPHNVLSHEILTRTTNFIKNFGAEQGVALPGRVPQFKNMKVQLLPLSETKSSVWRKYKTAADEANFAAVSYSKIVDIWSTFTPYIIIMTPATDLCHTCQMNNTKISTSVNIGNQEKREYLDKQQNHLNEARAEREFMKRCISECKVTLKDCHSNLLALSESCSFQGTVHYSYDYAQQVHIPSNPQQPGPIYFKTPRKCGLFGICCEGIPRQVNYLIDESVDSGKGANTVISYVHDFFKSHGVGETDVQIHADNCGGQNKNNYVIWYYCWRILCDLHQSIIYSFLITGHTKFSPDWCFGLLKQSFRRHYVSSLFDLLEAVDKSTNTGVNVGKLCGLHDGTILVPVYDWVSFLETYFKKMPGISKMHHFRFSKQHPGVVFCRKLINSPEIEFQLLKNLSVIPPHQLPEMITPKGLDMDRRRYLHKEIRQFCRAGTEDLVAPAP